MAFAVLIYSSVERKPTKYGRVVELVDSLDSGSSVHCGRAGSSPASPTKEKDILPDVLFLFARENLKETLRSVMRFLCYTGLAKTI